MELQKIAIITILILLLPIIIAVVLVSTIFFFIYRLLVYAKVEFDEIKSKIHSKKIILKDNITSIEDNNDVINI